MRRLILASTSPYRRAQLAQIGLSFEQCASGVDEDQWKLIVPTPIPLAMSLAKAKAEAVGKVLGEKAVGEALDSVIIAGDQVAAIEGEQLDKPGSLAGAVAQLQRLQGRTHQLHSAVAVLDLATGTLQCEVSSLDMTMRALQADEIERYLQHDEPFDCVGSYRIESKGIALFSSIKGDDHSGIMGIPLLVLTRMLLACGVSVI